MNKTSIEWTDYTWNPVEGCNKVSAGCKNCYAERLTKRWGRRHFTHVQMRPEKLTEPMKRRAPAKIFVCDMSDLFHEKVTDEFIKLVFSVMASATQHTFQVLTKRIDRAAALVNSMEWVHGILIYEKQILVNNCLGAGVPNASGPWTPPNIWIGTSVETQETALERIPILCEVKASKRFLSCEPLLGDVTIFSASQAGRLVDWVICGGESGPNARPMHPDWARRIRDNCQLAKIPFFFKQWGEWFPAAQTGHTHLLRGDVTDFSLPNVLMPAGFAIHRFKKLPKHRQGKYGRMLDGKVHQNFPSL